MDMGQETETFILIVGNCGSGKSTLGRRLSERLGAIFVDDPNGIDDIKQYINEYRTIVIADPWLCLTDVRQRAANQLKEFCPNAQHLWYFFENNKRQCVKNLRNREKNLTFYLPDYRIDFFAQYYEFPAKKSDGVTFPLIPVWKGVL